MPSQRLIRSLLLEIWCLKFSFEFPGRIRIRLRIRNCIAATAVHSKVLAFREIILLNLLLDHTPSTAGTFRKKFRKNSGKTPETLSERFLELPSRVRLGCPKPFNSRHLRLPERFQNSLPPQYGWGRLFFQNWFQRGALRAGHGIPSSTGGISDLWGAVAFPDSALLCAVLCSALSFVSLSLWGRRQRKLQQNKQGSV